MVVVVVSRRSVVSTLVLFALVLSIVVVYAYFTSVSINCIGRIKTLGLECDPMFIDWGFLEPGDVVNRTILVKPTGTESSILSLTTEAWDPLNASEFLLLSWNYTGAVLDPGEWISLELSLYVDPLIHDITSFSFDIVVAAESIS